MSRLGEELSADYADYAEKMDLRMKQPPDSLIVKKKTEAFVFLSVESA
jgi:hypothetical protein